jgi:TonB-dependent starch-binding outer membrane protein SusC
LYNKKDSCRKFYLNLHITFFKYLLIIKTHFYFMKKKYTIHVLLLALLCVSFLGIFNQAHANGKAHFSIIVEKKITGKITDESGNALPGTSVAVKGTSKGTAADASGNYSIVLPDNATTLVFSFTGYTSQEIVVGGRSVIDVQLRANVQSLDEVVVVGYGQVRKSDLTASVASVKAADIKSIVPTSLEQGLAGRATGVVVTQASGAPGGAVTVRVRGPNSISSGSEPLYVVDGIPIYSDNDATSSGGNRTSSNALASINPSDIESMEILKDASGTAIYGSRASNGVILITTRRGKSGVTKIDYEGSQTFMTVAKKLDLMNATQYAEYQNLRAVSRGQSAPYANPSQFGTGVNWQDETTRTGGIMNHQLTFSGGTDKTQFLVSTGYFKENGIIKNTDFERISLRTNLDSKFLNDKIRLGVSSFISTTGQNAIPTDRGGPGGAIITILGQSPIGPVYKSDGSYDLQSYDGRFLTNPLAEVQEVIDRDRGLRILGTTYLQFELMKDLYFKTSLGVDIMSNNRETYYSDQTRLGRERSRSYELGYRNIGNVLNENILSYSKQMGKNRLDAIVGYTYQTDNNRFGTTSSNGFTYNSFDVNNVQDGVKFLQPFSSKQQWVLQSFLARVNYNLMDKYLVTLTMRRDGSSKFGPNNKWANFPSVAFAWKMKEEAFMKDLTAVSDAKLRLSYGITGNSQIPTGRSLASLSGDNYLVGNNVVAGVRETRVANPDLRWETTKMTNLGLDLSFINNRLTASFDYFNNTTSDLLLNVALAPTTGFQTALQNSGVLNNKGFEVSLNYNAVNTKDFRWDIRADISSLKNEITDLAGAPPFYSYVGSHLGPEGSYVSVGQPLGGWFGYEYIGLWKNNDEIKNNPSIAGIDKPGYPRYKDVNNDGKIDISDRTYLGNPNPTLIWGLNSSFTYKSFDFSFFFRGSHGGKIRNLQASEHADGVGNYNQYAVVATDSWTPNNTSASRPVVDATREFPSFFRRSSFFIEDGSFVRLVNTQVGFRVPSNKYIRNARVYVSGQNLLTFTKYSGFDPEVSNGGQSPLNRGDDYDAYPRARRFTVGVQLGF